MSRSITGFDFTVHELSVPEEDLPADWQTWHPEHKADGIVHPNEHEGRLIEPDDNGIWDCCTTSQLKVMAAPLTHRVPSFGFVIQENEQPGKLDPKKLKELGIPPGPLYARIKNGETVVLESGLEVKPEDAVGPKRPGRKLVILGDTSCSSKMASIAMDTDILVHEATLEDELMEKCIENGHSTPSMAAKFANQINAKKLILTHFSQRYRAESDTSKEGDESVSKLVGQARAVFVNGDVVAAEDLMQIPVPAKK
ncbi:zinc phosphodiesterase ELAC protein 1-like [Glandiceps talaboti]